MGSEFIQPLLTVITVLVGVLVALTGFIGKRIFDRMDQIQILLRQAEKDIHLRIDDHEGRLTRVEAHCDIPWRNRKDNRAG